MAVSSMPANAKVGENVSYFVDRQKNFLKLKGTSNKGESVYYSFSLNLDESEKQAAPGFGAGVTVTAVRGEIVSESMAICLGRDRSMGQQLAGAYGLKFACDAIGRTVPGGKATQDRELEIFNKSAMEALNGASKEIRYPGFDPKIILSRSNDGNLLIAIVKPASLQPHVVTPVPAPPPVTNTGAASTVQRPPGGQSPYMLIPPSAVPFSNSATPAVKKTNAPSKNAKQATASTQKSTAVQKPAVVNVQKPNSAAPGGPPERPSAPVPVLPQ